MAYELEYDTYNPGQYSEQFKTAVAERIAAGWRVQTAFLNYNEVYILWERGGASVAELAAPVVCPNCQGTSEPEQPEEPQAEKVPDPHEDPAPE